MNNLLKSARWYIDHGLNIVACNANKLALVKWKKYQSELISFEDIEQQLTLPDAVGLSVICGQISGNLEVVDVDTKHDSSGNLMERLIASLGELYDKLYIVKTVSGGFHIYYRCEVIEGNQQLANTSDNLVIIETRGEGGYVVGPPTDKYKRIQGTEIPVISLDERDFILNTCRSFNAYWEPFKVPVDDTENKYSVTPGSDFNQRGDVPKLLEDAGWIVLDHNQENIVYKRPGSDPKKKTQSGNFRHSDKVLYIFSSSTEFKKPGAYSPFAVYAFLKCDGDFKEAAKQLSKSGYGTRKLMHVSGEKSHKLDLATDALAAQWDIRKNIVSEQIEMKKRSDSKFVSINISSLYIWLNTQAHLKISRADVKDIIDGGYPLEFDPFLEYFESLEYDSSADFIELLSDHVLMEDGFSQTYWANMFKKAIVRMVPQAIGSDINRVLMVLQGDKQKTGKSTFIRFLNPFKSLYYTEAKITGNEKDVSIRLTENFIYNIEELEGIHRKEMGFIKSMLSTQYCKDRRPFATYESVRTRRVNFWGSTNPREILQDSENTRWLIFPVKAIDWGYKQEIDINKVWAQACHLYKSGKFNYELTSDEVAIQANNNEQFETAKPEEELIGLWFSVGKDDDFMTATQICHELNIIYDRTKLYPSSVGKAVRKLFNIKAICKRVDGVPIKGYKIVSKLPKRSL